MSKHLDRRTGGLEKGKITRFDGLKLDRRTGGLEIMTAWIILLTVLDRRTGGLEMAQTRKLPIWIS